MRPSLKALYIFGGLILVSLAVVVFAEEGAMITVVLAGIFLVILFLDGLKSWPGSEFSIRHRLPNCLYMGATDHMELEVIVPDAWGACRMEIAVDVEEKITPVTVFYLMIDSLSRNLGTVPLTPLLRGKSSVDRIWVRWQGPLGLASWTRRIDIMNSLPILPNIRSVSQDAVKFSARDALFGIKPQWQLGNGSEFDALREYVPGFDSRAIDWKSSARHHKLICKEFQTERNHQIILAYDTAHLMREPINGIPKLDHGINCGLLLSYLSLKNGDRVGVMGFDSKVRQYLGPTGGVQNFTKIQQVTADLSYSSEEANYTLAMAELLSRLNRRSLIILLTDFEDTVTADLMIDNLKRLSERHLVVFVSLRDKDVFDFARKQVTQLDDLTGTVIAQDFIQERAIVLEKLTRMGVQCLDTSVEDLKVDLLNSYLHIKRREMI
tara:strand:+ start:2206 stop:3516 length:1311 start_codon:yes stop_codon:yes gene_type:complete